MRYLISISNRVIKYFNGNKKNYYIIMTCEHIFSSPKIIFFQSIGMIFIYVLVNLFFPSYYNDFFPYIHKTKKNQFYTIPFFI